MMPEEIMEHIFSFMDPLTLLQCCNVSKYWRFHASKGRIKSIVLDTYEHVVHDCYGMKVLLRRARLNGRKLLLEYPANYPIDNRLRDIALAEKGGKKLLELDLSEVDIESLTELLDLDEYVVKTTASILHDPDPNLFIGTKIVTVRNDAAFQSILAYNEDGPHSPDEDAKYEVMLDLKTYCDNEANHLIMVRNLSPQKKRFGIILLDDSFVQVMVLLLVPVIAHDVLYSEILMTFFKQWFGVAAFIALTVFVLYASWDLVQTFPDKKNIGLFKKLMAVALIVSIIGFIWFYPRSSTHFGFIGSFIVIEFYLVTALYQFTFGDTLFKPKSKNKLRIFIVCIALVLLINDWSMTVRSIIDGIFWHRLLWNTIHYLLFSVYFMWLGLLIDIIIFEENNPLAFTNIFKKETIVLMTKLYGATLLATLYAPYWQHNQ